MKYAIRQTYINYQTGEYWTGILPRRWKTRQGAEKAAQAAYRWTTMPDGKIALDNSDADVIEAPMR